MAWEPRDCPFCHENFSGKIPLDQHLQRYWGALRVPADAIHDVLQIDKMLYPGSKKQVKKYECPECSIQINDQKRFVRHVINNKHYGRFLSKFDQGVEGQCQSGPWGLPFNEETVLITERKGVFNFLSLPYDLRQIVYEFLLVFNSIEFETFYLTASVKVVPTKHGNWLQHNPKNNLLSLFAVNRQMYEEARHMFYSRNSFVFDHSNSFLIFLFGIGPRNACLLRSVQSTSSELSMNLIDAIRSCLPDETASGTMTDVWNDVKLHDNFFKHIDLTPPIYPHQKKLGSQLFRPGVDRPESHSVRKRYILQVSLACFYDHLNEGTISEERRVRAGYELYGEE